MIWNTLRKAIQRMERVTGKRRRHDPLMMRLVQALVQQFAVQATMDPVNEEIRKHDEEGYLEDVVRPERRVFRSFVQFGVAADFTEEERGGEDGHHREGAEGLSNLKPDLISEVARMGEGQGAIEDKDVGCGGEKEVNDTTKEPVRCNTVSDVRQPTAEWVGPVGTNCLPCDQV